MSSEQNGDTQGPQSEADLAQAFKELQRGEQTAAALENHLESLEKKIEALLAQAEKAEQELKTDPASATEKVSEDEQKPSL